MKDLLDNELSVGNYVIYSIGEYNNLIIGKIIKETKHKVAVQLLHPDTLKYRYTNPSYLDKGNTSKFIKLNDFEIAKLKMKPKG